MLKTIIRASVAASALAFVFGANAVHACRIEDWNIGRIGGDESGNYTSRPYIVVGFNAAVSCESGEMSIKFVNGNTEKFIVRRTFSINFYQISDDFELRGPALGRYQRTSSIGIRDIKYRP